MCDLLGGKNYRPFVWQQEKIISFSQTVPSLLNGILCTLLLISKYVTGYLLSLIYRSALCCCLYLCLCDFSMVFAT